MSLADPRVANPVLASLRITKDDKIIFIKEHSAADSNFIITHLLKQFLYEKCRICFLTLHNAFGHYQNVGKKLGYDLKQSTESGLVSIVNPLEEYLSRIGDGSQDDIETRRSDILNDTFGRIKEQIDHFTSVEDLPVCLIVDDISHFFDLGINVGALLSFTNQCINLAGDDGRVSVIINSHVSSKSDLILARSIQYVCDVTVHVTPLRTSKNTDSGVISIKRGTQEERYHFKTFDRGVKTFHPSENILNLYA